MAADRPASPDNSPAKFRHDCKTCTSPWRAEIEARLARGDSARGISVWLEAEHGEHIRHDALGRHWKLHRAGAPEPAQKPPPPSARVATVTPLRPGQPRQQARQAAPRPDSRPDASEPATEVHVWKPDLSGLDELALELFQTVQAVGRTVRGNPDEMTFPQSTLMAGLARELGKLVQIRNMVTGGGLPGQKKETPADGLKALVGNSPPPAIEGDEPDGEEDEDEYLRPPPRWADGEPDGEPDREVVEGPVEETPPAPQPSPTPRAPEPAMAGPAPKRPFIWQPPRR
jgi:hypothetical protein